MANIYRPIVPLELVEELRELAAESERSLAAEIRFGLSQHVARRRGIESERGSALTYVLAQHLMLRDGIAPGKETYEQLADALQRAEALALEENAVADMLVEDARIQARGEDR